MNTPKQQKPFFLYIIISILAVAVIGLGGLALYSLNGLASLQSKVTELQDTTPPKRSPLRLQRMKV